MSKDALTCVLIGTGAIGREHIQALASPEFVTLAAVCDLSPARVRATAERYSIARHFTDYRKMLAEVPAQWVHITTPPSSHYSIAKDCLEAGLNVICEKPITIRLNEFEKLRKLASAKQLCLLENQNFRFHSSVLKIMDFVQSGQMGDIANVDIQWAQNLFHDRSPYVDPNLPHYGLKLPGGVIGDFLPHLSYLATMFAGAPQSVSAIWRKQVSGSPLPYDEFRALVDCQQAPATICFSSSAQPDGLWLRVWGTKLYAEANLFEPPRLQVRRLRSAPPPLPSLVNGMGEAFAIGKGSLASVARKLAGKSSYDGLAEFINATYRAYLDGQPQPVSLEEIGRNLRLARDVTKSGTSQ